MEKNKQARKEHKRRNAAVYIILRVLVVACLVSQLFRENWHGAFLCLVALALFTLPAILQKSFKIALPGTLEVIILFFILSGTVLGEIYNFYGHFPNFDTVLHTVNGFLCAGVGFALVDLLNKNSKELKLSPLYMAVAAFCFSMTVGAVWEFFERGMDSLFQMDMQKDRIVTTVSTVLLDPLNSNTPVVISGIAETVMYDAEGNALAVVEGGYLDVGIYDTMKDLFVNFIGAVVFSVFGYFYVKNREKYTFTTRFIPKKITEENEDN